MRVNFNFDDLTQNSGPQWHDYLCEYYDVSPTKALELGTRSDGRRPSLPGSKTCEPVSGKTLEDIWVQSERKTDEQVFQFYRDQGAWSTFRQTVRHKDLVKYHKQISEIYLMHHKDKSKLHVCEYGCGIAPFTSTFLEYSEASIFQNSDILI